MTLFARKKGQLTMLKSVTTALAAMAMVFGHAAHAQVTPGGPGYNDLSQPRGFSVTAPSIYQPRNYVTPNSTGGYTVTTPGQPSTFINPNGNGYTVMTPGRPLTFIKPN